MIRLDDLHITLGGNPVIEGLSAQINPGEKVALTGRNGAGKTTLLRALAGEIRPEKGKIHLPKDARIGYLRQLHTGNKDTTLFREAMQAFPELLEIENRMRRLEQASGSEKESPAWAQEWTDLEFRYRTLGGYTYRGTLEKILKGLGFDPGDFQKPLSAFSGGWQMRVELAKILAGGRDILLLDEPTNYLDLESILWLENFLKNYEGILILVSHDRRFLDTVTRRTLELGRGRYLDMPFPYTVFMEKRRELVEKQRREAINREKEIRQTEQLIERFRYKATKAAFAQSLIKKLEKMGRPEMPPPDTPTIRLRFPPVEPSGKSVFRAQGLSKAYGTKQVLRNLEFHIARGEKIAFVGRNGTGKTTLASILAGVNDYSGLLETGHNVRIGYFAQDQSTRLPREMRVLDYLEHCATEQTRPKMRDVAGAFLFSGDEVFKPVEVLSGGERNRLALAGMMLQAFNVLIMDEPTNHLDIPSKEVLKSALKDFPGTLIVVSHDRDFLESLTGQTWEFRPLEVRKYHGDIKEFLQQRRLDELNRLELESRPQQKSQPAETSRKDGQIRKEWLKQRRRWEKQAQKIEAEIEVSEGRLQEMEQQLGAGTVPDPGFYEQYQSLREHIEELYRRWEETQARAEELSRRIGE